MWDESFVFQSDVHCEEVSALFRAYCWVIFRMALVNIASLDSRFKSCLLYQLIANLCDVFCVLETRQGQSDKTSLLGTYPPGFLFFNNSSYAVLVVGKHFFLPCWSHSTLPLNLSFTLLFPFLPHITNCFSDCSGLRKLLTGFSHFLALFGTNYCPFCGL